MGSRRSSAELTDGKRLSHLKISKSLLAQLHKVAEQEEREMIVYFVREELMKRVMDEIYRRYLERQSIKFTVDCAHKALVQTLKTEFLVHDKGRPFYVNHPAWVPDRQPEPSAPDSWAARNVKIRPTPRPEAAPSLSTAFVDAGAANAAPSQGQLKMLYAQRKGAFPSSSAVAKGAGNK